MRVLHHMLAGGYNNSLLVSTSDAGMPNDPLDNDDTLQRHLFPDSDEELDM